MGKKLGARPYCSRIGRRKSRGPLAFNFHLQTAYPGPGVVQVLPEAHGVLGTAGGLGATGHLISLAGSHRISGLPTGFSLQS